MIKIKSKIFLAASSAIFIVAGFFGFGVLSPAHAACSYSMTTDVTPKTISVGQSLKFSATVTRAGSTSECTSAIRFSLNLQGVGKFGQQRIAFNGSTASYTFNFNTQPYNSMSTMTFTIGAANDTGTVNLLTSDPIVVPVSGAGAASGTVGIQITFEPPKGTYNNGDRLYVWAILDQAGVSKLGSEVTDIYFDFSLNGKNTYSITKTITEVKTKSYSWLATVNTANGFKNGSNAIVVSIWQAGKNLKLGQGTANLTATGLGSTSSSQPQAVIDNSSPAFGSTIHITIQNPPAGHWSAIMNFEDGSSIPIAQSPFPLTISAAKGFEDKTKYSGEIQIFDSTGQLKGTSSFSLDVGGSAPAGGGTPGGGTPGSNTNPSNITDKLYNPIPNARNLTELLVNIMKGFLAILGVWAVAFVVIGGFRMVISQGNEEAVAAAKKTILWAVLGLVIAMLAFAIIAIVQNLIGTEIQPMETSQIISVIKNV